MENRRNLGDGSKFWKIRVKTIPITENSNWTRSGLVLVLCLYSSGSFQTGCAAPLSLFSGQHEARGRWSEQSWTKGYVDGCSRGLRQPTCRSVRSWRGKHVPQRVCSLCGRLHQCKSDRSRCMSTERPHRVLHLGLSCLSGGAVGTISKLQDPQVVFALAEAVVWHHWRRASPRSWSFLALCTRKPDSVFVASNFLRDRGG